ncbi:alpha-methylacyl-CoA racemase-like [Panonychus citri]|uniref:alpha-methylacyl-CoA racemase-like n=1 Tax=Panonychus citri TaxID=50023 RepID=UPI002307664C|nr:alpha-methylacyl-CoA racemase-like [Panonychus citri]
MALKNIRVIELAGLAPAPFCGLILSDFGAEVIKVDKIGGDPLKCLLSRGKKGLEIDLKRSEGIKLMEKLCSKADVLIEPYRPGVMEKMGLGPEQLMKSNKRLIYARLSGYGQQGPFSRLAGHDINYLAVSGVLSLLKDSGTESVPRPPINLLADFAAGGALCALGIAMALVERNTSGLGQVVDANMTEGSSYLATWIRESKAHPFLSSFIWPNNDKPGENTLDGGAPFYSVYKTADEKFMAVGSLEPPFFARLVDKVGLEGDFSPGIIDPAMKQQLEEKFSKKTQNEWIEIFKDVDACVTPVVNFDEASQFSHNKEAKSFLSDGSPIPAPRLNRTTANPVLVERQIDNLRDFLVDHQLENTEIDHLIKNNIVALPLTNSKL